MINLRETLEKNKNIYIQHLSNLVAIDTHDLGHGIDGGFEINGQKYMQSLFKEMDADEILIDSMKEEVIQKSIEHHDEGNPGHNYDNRYNVYATFKGKGGKSLMFNGHIDTMPAGNEELWSVHPHKSTIHDKKMYGLGVCDMKGGLMAATMAIKLLQDTGIDLPGDVKITSVVDEEGGGNGSILAAINGQKSDGVVVCEPTGDELILAHMGFVFFKVEVEGKAIQSGLKRLGVSAIEKAFKLVDALSELEHKWLMTYKHPLLPSPSLNVGTINGGTAGSTVAGKCSFKVCVHYLPKLMNKSIIEKEFTETIQRRSNGDEWLNEHPPKITIYQAGGAFEMDKEHSFVCTFIDSYENALGKKVKIGGSPAGSDSRIWNNIAECPTLQFGPGNLEQCHAVDEYLSIDAYLEAILVYAYLILKWGKE
ncbi:M20 family metallopeptidase [Clostridium sediminicola]|uniref:M20 family metallopeptidase n=1 Tax=Clostridium sediminicola TaxID=3114879 RepID=UPI0031F20ADA